MTTDDRPEPRPLVLTFAPPVDPKSENDVRGQHWAKVRDMLRPWHNTAWVLTRNEMVRGRVPWLGHRAVVVHVSIPFRTLRGRDPHNYVGTVVKAIVDGVKDAGLVPEDTAEWVEVLEPTLTVAPKNQRGEVVVTITERNPTP